MDPRIVHVASELDVSLERTAENEGNLEFILDVIAAVDYANEMVSGEAPAAPEDDCVICHRHANHNGLCCAHRYDEQPPCDNCPSGVAPAAGEVT